MANLTPRFARDAVQRTLLRFMAPEITRRVRLAVRALDDPRDSALSQGAYPRDRYAYDRLDVLRDALDAWRANPLARRIVALTSQYVVGGGLDIASDHLATDAFLKQWWNHPLNHLPVRAFEWCDELTRAGNLFVLLSTDEAGMSYVRAFPAANIAEIVTAPNDVEQPIAFKEKPSPAQLEGRTYPAYDPQEVPLGPHPGPPPSGPSGLRPSGSAPTREGAFPVAMLHYAINRPVGAAWGEPDLAPITRWLARYAAWLEDRVRLNRFRSAFIYVVRGLFPSAAERLERQAELNANPPNPGSILVADQTEEWEVLHPKLDSFDAERDGLTIKKMIAAGSGSPLHFLAEPESSTRTTADAAGGPTYRHYEQRQLFFTWALADLARAAVRRAALLGADVDPDSNLTVTGGDISPRDNAALANAGSALITSASQLRDRETIDDEELLRLVYKFLGEHADIPAMLARGKKAGKPKVYGAGGQQFDPSLNGREKEKER